VTDPSSMSRRPELGELDPATMDRAAVGRWVREEEPARLERLWAAADAVRQAHVGDEVHLRGLVELSNVCVRQCAYCGIRAGHRGLRRYRMTADEVLACAREITSFGFGTAVLQSGEDYGLTRDWVADVVRRIKRETPLAVTLSLGERSEADLLAWREAGADRYLLRFETSDPELYARIHPQRPGQEHDRFWVLRRLRDLGYEVGSGMMVGIPGQTWDTLAGDVWTLREYDHDMIGIGPFIPHPDTPLGSRACADAGPEQVPPSEDVVLRAVALARLVCPGANIPSTTALATINPLRGREHGLQRGANVVMPNFTPSEYRVLYEIYPGKACLHETAGTCRECLVARIEGIGRTVGVGPGGSRRGRGPLQVVPLDEVAARPSAPMDPLCDVG
jgi:biotin synthase